MTASAAEAMAWAQGQLWAGFLVFLRVGPLAALAPAFGEQAVPARVKLMLGLAFTLIVLPAAAPALPPPPTSPARLLALVLGEVAAGLLLGIALRLLVMALLMAGTIAAQSTSLSQLLGGGPGGEPSPALGHLLVAAALALAATLGLHVRVAAYILQGYALLPPGAALDPAEVLAAGLQEVARATALAFGLAAPFVAAALLYNLALGVINRAMPQLMVTFIGAPAMTAGGLGLMLLAAPLMLQVWSAAFAATLAAPFGALP